MGGQGFWDNFFELLWNPENWAKGILLLVTLPLWGPMVRALWRELQEVLAPEGGLYGKRKPRAIARRPAGEDPFLKIPLASRRSAGPQSPADPDDRDASGHLEAPHELEPFWRSPRAEPRDERGGRRRPGFRRPAPAPQRERV